MSAKTTKPFASEVELCKAFIEILPEGWTPYAETAGFDILLVRDADGVQIGVEAKLKLNAEVVAQALEDGGYFYAERSNPDYRAVLVPMGGGSGFHRISAYIGFTIIRVEAARDYAPVPGHSWRLKPKFYPDLPGTSRHHDDRDWHPWATTKRCKLPEYVPDVAAGASAPLQLTDWKIAALRIEATLEIRGFVTRHDFAAHRIDHRRWLAREGGWLVNRDGRLVAGPRFPNFKGQHPQVYAEILAKAGEWIAPAPPSPAQEALL